MPEAQRPLKVFLCHAHADTTSYPFGAQVALRRDAVKALYDCHQRWRGSPDG